MCVYLHAKFEVSSIILISFRQGAGEPLFPSSKKTPKNSTQISVKLKLEKIKKNFPRKKKINFRK